MLSTTHRARRTLITTVIHDLTHHFGATSTNTVRRRATTRAGSWWYQHTTHTSAAAAPPLCGVSSVGFDDTEEDERRRYRSRRMIRSLSVAQIPSSGFVAGLESSFVINRWTSSCAFSTTAHSSSSSNSNSNRGKDPSSSAKDNSSSVTSSSPNPTAPSTSTSTSTSTSNTSNTSTPKKTLTHLFQTYGWTFVGTYFTIYVLTLSTLFIALDSSLIEASTLKSAQLQLPWHSGTNAEEIEAAADARWFRKTVASYADVLFEKTRPWLEKNPHLGNLAVAWVATKFTEPVRLPVAVMLVPKVAKVLGRKKMEKMEKMEREKERLGKK